MLLKIRRRSQLVLTLMVLTALLSVFSFSPLGVAQAALTARPGDYLDYAVQVSNSGPVVGTGVTVTDPLDVSLGTPTNISNGGTYDSVTRTITWTGLSIPAASGATPGTLTLTFRGPVNITVPAGTVVNNTATISPPIEGGPGSVVVAPPVTIVTPDLSTSTKGVGGQAGPGNTARPGNTLTYTVNLINTGPVAANNIPVTDVIDASLGTPSAISNGGVYNAGTRTITWGGLTVPAASGATPGTLALTYQTQINASTPDLTVINNTAVITPPPGQGPGSSPSAPQITVTTPILSATKAVVGQAGPGNTARPGNTLTYTVTISNAGSIAGTGVSVSDVLDVALAAPTAISNGGTYTAGTRTLSWSGLTIPAASGGTPGTLALTYQSQIPAGTVTGTLIDNTAVISPPVEGGSGATAIAPQITVTTPTLLSTKDVSGQAGPGYTAHLGDNLTYTIKIKNSGTVDATNLTTTDVIDVSLGTPTAISNGGTYDSVTRTITWTGLSVPAASGATPGETDLSYKAQVLLTVADGTLINNTATISPPPQGGSGTTATAPVITVSIPNLSTSTKGVSGQAGPGYTARPGNNLTYTVTLNNTGSIAGTGVSVTDVIDASLATPTNISNGGTYNATTRTITWTGLNVWPASPLALTYKAQVLTTATNGTVINNTAVISPPLEGGPGSSPSAPQITVTTPNLSGSSKGVTVVPGP